MISFDDAITWYPRTRRDLRIQPSAMMAAAAVKNTAIAIVTTQRGLLSSCTRTIASSLAAVVASAGESPKSGALSSLKAFWESGY